MHKVFQLLFVHIKGIHLQLAIDFRHDMVTSSYDMAKIYIKIYIGVK